ncbi:hypothetical protein GOP47_0027707 [Adiantum capillus-veneris]|nr:hypothetical protein GOP47_0027707 [Adiantum capillus-veneris]
MSPFGKKSFDASKCVSLLEVTQKRIGILRKKRSIIAKQSRADVAKLLERGQDANAAARAEHVFREENVVAAYELLEQHCQLVIKGVSAIKSHKECSLELKEAIASLIYAAPRCGDLQELQKVRDIFISRYGADYIAAILELRPECAVNMQIIQKLSSRPPNSDVRLNLLKEIALEYNINWSYQRAVAASFKNAEASEKSNVSLTGNVASKQGLTDDALPSVSIDAKSKESAASLPAQTATPVKASIVKSEASESVKKNQPLDVSGNSTNKPREKGQASFVATHNVVPVSVHENSSRERHLMGANKGSSKGSPTTVDTPMNQDISKGNTSFTPHNSSSSTIRQAEPRNKEFVDMDHISPVDMQKQSSSSVMHQDSSSLWARYGDHFTSSKEVLDVGAPPKVKPVSVFPGQEYTSERAALGNRALPSRTKVSPVQSSDASMSVPPRELDGPMRQTVSTPAFYEAKVSSSKPEPYSTANIQADGIGKPLAAKGHQNFVKVDSIKTDEDSRGKNLSQIKFQPKQGVVDPAPNNIVDAHVESISHHQSKDYRNAHQQPKSFLKALNKEEVKNSGKDYAVHQMNGTGHQRVVGSVEIQERSGRGNEGVNRTLPFVQGRNEHDKNSSENKKCSTIAGPNTRHSIPPSELRSMKVEVDEELADLEIAIASASRAADKAMEMLRTCSIRSRSDKKGFQRERNSQIRTSYGDVNLETGVESRKAFHNTLNQQDHFARDKLYTDTTVQGDLEHKEPFQEQEPVSLDSEMPQFDDSSDDSTPEELPPFSKSRLSLRNDHVCVNSRKASNLTTKSSGTPFWTQGQNDLSRESLHVFTHRNLQKGTFRDGDCAESVDSFSPQSSSSSHQHPNSDVFYDVQPSYKTQIKDYEEPDNVCAWSAVLQSRKNAYAVDDEKVSGRSHGIGNNRVSDMKIANQNVEKGVLRWQGLSTGDVSKKIQQPSQPYKQHEVMTTQNSGEKFQGVSRRHEVGYSDGNYEIGSRVDMEQALTAIGKEDANLITLFEIGDGKKIS